jgi:hypothetical protein
MYLFKKRDLYTSIPYRQGRPVPPARPLSLFVILYKREKNKRVPSGAHFALVTA